MTFKNKYITILIKILSIIIPIYFIFSTLYRMTIRIPFFDEAYAYLIAQLNLGEIFNIAHIEGHQIIWYLLIKIFTLNNNFYPLNLYLLNWLIMSAIVIMLWKKSPFNIFVKILITFSIPFFGYLGVIARPYGLSLLSLLLLTIYYKKAIKRPILYTFLICFSLNITVLSAIGASAFLILFLLNIFKNKEYNKDILYSLFILLIGVAFLIMQFIGAHPAIHNTINFFPKFKEHLILYSIFPFISLKTYPIFRILMFFISSLLFYISFFIFLKNDKTALFFISYNYIVLTILFTFFYNGFFWHHYFYFYIFIITLWLAWEKISNFKFYNILIIVFLLFMTLPQANIDKNFNTFDIFYTSKYYKQIVDKISYNNEYRNSKLFCFEWFDKITPAMLPYFEKQQIKIYDIKGFDKTSFKSMEHTYEYMKLDFKPDEFIQHLSKKKKNYLIIQKNTLKALNTKNTKTIGNDFYIKGDKYKIYFKFIEGNINIQTAIFEIIPFKI